MAGRKIQCGICKEKFDKEELIQRTKTQKVCQKCMDTKGREIREYNELIDYICKGLGQDSPTPTQVKNVRRFNKEFGYSYKTIQCIIYYMYVVEKVKTKDNNLGLVPFYFEKTQNHYKMIENAKKSIGRTMAEEIVVEISKQKNSRVDKTRLIDISSIV